MTLKNVVRNAAGTGWQPNDVPAGEGLVSSMVDGIERNTNAADPMGSVRTRCLGSWAYLSNGEFLPWFVFSHIRPPKGKR